MYVCYCLQQVVYTQGPTYRVNVVYTDLACLPQSSRITEQGRAWLYLTSDFIFLQLHNSVLYKLGGLNIAPISYHRQTIR
jgi:hypothetical protein